jgi:hypothetical protein
MLVCCAAHELPRVSRGDVVCLVGSAAILALFAAGQVNSVLMWLSGVILWLVVWLVVWLDCWGAWREGAHLCGRCCFGWV